MDAVAYLTYLKEKKISKNAPPKLLIEKVIFFRQTKTNNSPPYTGLKRNIKMSSLR